MILSNAMPKGDVQGELAVIEIRALGLDGHASTGIQTVAHTRFSLLAHIEMMHRLLAELDADAGAEVVEMKRA